MSDWVEILNRSTENLLEVSKRLFETEKENKQLREELNEWRTKIVCPKDANELIQLRQIKDRLLEFHERADKMKLIDMKRDWSWMYSSLHEILKGDFIGKH